METRPVRQLDLGDVTVVWGNATEAKASLREQSIRQFQAFPVAERLRRALDLLLPARKDSRDGQP